MSLPTMQEARSRQTAMEAERHAFVSRLIPIVSEMFLHAADLHVCGVKVATYVADNANAQAAAEQIERWARKLDALIRERTK